MSLQDLADELGKNGRKLTRAILSKYELGQTTPNALVLRDLARILDVKTDYFFTESTVTIAWQAFRKKASVSQTTQEKVKIMAASNIERFITIENACGIDPEPSDLPAYRSLSTPEQAESIAEELRSYWNLDDFPIKSLAELLESKGIVLVPLSSDVAGIDGLVGSLSGNRKIIVYEEDKSVERTRLTMAHELGHLLMGNDDPKINEKLANRFAGAFLAPAKKLRRDMGNCRMSFSITELCLLKEKYGMSIQSLTFRAKDLGILNEAAYRSMFIYFRSRGIGTNEPGFWACPEEPLLAKQYLFRAVAEGRLSETKAQEIYPEYFEVKTDMETLPQKTIQSFLGLSPEARNKWLYNAADSAAGLYERGELIKDAQVIDDLEEYE